MQYHTSIKTYGSKLLSASLLLSLTAPNLYAQDEHRSWQSLEALWNHAVTQAHEKQNNAKKSGANGQAHSSSDDDGSQTTDQAKGPWHQHAWAGRGKFSTLIQDLTDRVTELEAQSSALTLQLSELGIQVSENTASLENIVLRVDEMRETQALLTQAQMENTEWLTQVALSVQDLSAELQTQREHLTALIAEQTAAIETNEQALSALRTSLLRLSADNIALTQLLQTQTSALQSEIDTLQTDTASNSTTILTTQSELATLNTTISSALADYNYLSALYLTLKDLTEQNEAQLAALEETVNTLALNGGSGTGGSNSLATYTFTDAPDQDDSGHVNALRAFLLNTPTVGRWVNVVFSTPATNRTTEICFQDNTDIFNRARDTSPHSYAAVNGGAGTYRLNNGDWMTATVMRVQTRNDDRVNYVYIGAATPDTAVAALTNFKSTSAVYDSLHQKRYYSIELSSPTTAVYTVGDDRLSVCGY